MDIHAFLAEAFQSGDFQTEAEVVYAYQQCAFQADAFQADACQAPEPVVPVIIGGGGYIRKQKKAPANFGYPLDARRSQRHVPKTAKKIIEELAEKQVEERTRSGFEEQLVAALDAAELAYREFYLELLQIEREKIIDAEIKALFELKRLQDEEEEVLAMLLLM